MTRRIDPPGYEADRFSDDGTPLFRQRRFIGIDGGSKTGFAVWNAVTEEFEDIATLDFWRAYTRTTGYPQGTVIVVEMPRGATFDHDVARSPESARRREKISRNVGSVQRESELLAAGIEQAGYRVVRVRPKSHKLNQATFSRLTGWKGRTSQHARDAAMLVFGLYNVPSELSPGALSLSLYAPPDSDRKI